MGPRPINDVEPEKSQDDMAREQLGPLGRRAQARMGRQVEENTPTIRFGYCERSDWLFRD